MMRDEEAIYQDADIEMREMEIAAAERAATEREVRLEEERVADLIERENVRGISAPDY